MTGQSSYSVPTPHLTVCGSNVMLQNFTPQQIQSLIGQFNSHVRVQENQVPSSTTIPQATITDHGIMASTSTSGNMLFPFSSLTYINNHLKFKNNCLSTLPFLLHNDTWIIDSGASSHVCSDLAKFTSLTPVDSVSVTLPNGSAVPITHTGTIHINDKLILFDVLLVPDFKFNLISVSCLVKTLGCAAHFFYHGCFIHELSRSLMIGKGNLHHNLYILSTESSSTSTHLSSSSLAASILVEEHIWHQRLRHPSSIVLQKLTHHLPAFKNDASQQSHCPVYLLSKQKRLGFTSRNNLASKPFDLVHLDIWGPFKVESVEGYRYFLTIVDDCTRVT